MIKILFWIISFSFSAIVVLFLSFTGNYHSTHATYKTDHEIKRINFPRYQEGEDGCVITIPVTDSALHATLFFSPDRQKWFPVDFRQISGQGFVAVIPPGDPGTKYYYYIEAENSAITSDYNRSKPVRIVYYADVSIAYKFIFIFLIIISTGFAIVSLLYRYIKQFDASVYIKLATYMFGFSWFYAILVHYLYYHAIWTMNPFVLNITLDKLLLVSGFWGITLWRENKNDQRFHPFALILTIVLLFIPNF